MIDALYVLGGVIILTLIGWLTRDTSDPVTPEEWNEYRELQRTRIQRVRARLKENPNIIYTDPDWDK